MKRLNKILGSSGGSRRLVFGDIGVGKTTFVNVVRSNAYENGYFTPFKEIAVQQDWSPLEFILNTLGGIYGTLKISKNRHIDKYIFDKLIIILDNRQIKDWNVSLAGTGGGMSTTINTPTLTIQGLETLFQEVIRSIQEKTGKDIIIHYNNLELLPEKKLKYLLDNLRDFFQLEGIHFVFVGNLTIYSIIQSIPRFSSNLNDTPFHIEALSLKEVEEVLNRWFKALNMEKEEITPIIPYTCDSLEELYRIFGGNIRDILNSLQVAIIDTTE
ncbi:MAG: P-loop NTPase fold protein [Candidatus Aenigmatarchaeota archaeon]